MPVARHLSTSQHQRRSTTQKQAIFGTGKTKAHVVKQIMKGKCERIQIPKMTVFSDVYGNIFGE